MSCLFSCGHIYETHWTFLTYWRWPVCIETPNCQHHSHPKYPYHPKALVFGDVFLLLEITQRPLHFGEIENISPSLKLKTPILETWTNLHAYTQIPIFLPVPSLRILGVCECQSHPIIHMINHGSTHLSSIHQTVCPKQLVPISGLMHFSTRKYNMQYNAIFYKNNHNFLLAFRVYISIQIE